MAEGFELEPLLLQLLAATPPNGPLAEGLTKRLAKRQRWAVNKGEARTIALANVAELRKMTWEELRDRYLNRPETVEISGPSGTVYQVETQAGWDSRKDGDLRLFVSVDDGGWRAFMPLSESFILAPDGSFVGE